MEMFQPPKRRLLFTPGPLTTSLAVKSSLLCEDQSPRDVRFMGVLKDVRMRVTRIVGTAPAYQAVLLSCSGTGSVESMLLAAARDKRPLLIINNGAYGQRMVDIAKAHGLDHMALEFSPLAAIDLSIVEQCLSEKPGQFSALAVVHHETTTGLLNDIEALGKLCRLFNVPFIVDAMSSFAAIDIDMASMNIHLLATSSNKNLQGMPGIGIVVLDAQYACAQMQKPINSFYLDCLAEWQAQEQTGQARFTLPVQIIRSLTTALDEFENEGRARRLARYRKNWQLLVDELCLLGFSFLLPEPLQSKLIVSVMEPKDPAMSFSAISAHMTKNGIDIYPGKLPGYKYFRLCTVGDLYENDMLMFLEELRSFMHHEQRTCEVI